jgi:putative Mn2+ efflux pump MntP
MELLLILIIAVSLSMDAFSLSLAYGTLNLDKKTISKLSTIVGIFHFFMPILGMLVGTFITTTFPINSSILVFIILTFIGLQMIIESFKKEEYKNILNIYQLLLFGLAVSIDSFSVGIGLKSINKNFILCSSIFSLCSFTFTYFGLILGKKINHIIGKTSTIIAGMVLIVIGIIYLLG